MKIEKVSDTQIRVTLSHSDLTPRDIKISELAYGSQKAQELFREMMDQAYEEFGFETENIPLMIEAIPLPKGSIMIVVTKIEDPSEIDERLDGFGEHPSHRMFNSNQGEINTQEDIPLTTTHDETEQEDDPALIYSFPTLDQVTNAGHRINSIYCGMNSLYKKGNGTYFLVLHPNFMHKTSQEQLEAALSEFGQKHISSSLSERYLMEHHSLLIKNKAIEVLTTYL
ncbi:MAG: adaptor protein MecA [Epulopiscium sp.]|nr:adaptor protein MecA [Candidatus Epulonipiscium sp.]